MNKYRLRTELTKVWGDGKLRTWEDSNRYIHLACDVRVSEIQLCGKKDNDDRPF